MPFCPLLNRPYVWFFSAASMKPYISSRPSIEQPNLRFPSTNSFISAKLNRSKFCTVMFIYPQHALAGRTVARRRFQAHLVLETNPQFRLIVHWKSFRFQADLVLDNSPDTLRGAPMIQSGLRLSWIL
jgi:hypothetical protein